MSSLKEKVQSCPFCGNDAYFTRTKNGTQMAKVGCAVCGIEMKCAVLGYGEDTPLSKDIVTAWNQRAARPAPQGEATSRCSIPYTEHLTKRLQTRSELMGYIEAALENEEESDSSMERYQFLSLVINDVLRALKAAPEPSAPQGEVATLIAEARGSARNIREAETHGDATIADPDQLDELAEALEQTGRYAKRLEGRLGNATQELKQIKSGWESEDKYKQVAQSRRGDRRAVIRKLLKAEQERDVLMAELEAVMYSVDKWFPEDDTRLQLNPATRAGDAREIALKAIERGAQERDVLARGFKAAVAQMITSPTGVPDIKEALPLIEKDNR